MAQDTTVNPEQDALTKIAAAAREQTMLHLAAMDRALRGEPETTP